MGRFCAAFQSVRLGFYLLLGAANASITASSFASDWLSLGPEIPHTQSTDNVQLIVEYSRLSRSWFAWMPVCNRLIYVAFHIRYTHTHSLNYSQADLFNVCVEMSEFKMFVVLIDFFADSWQLWNKLIRIGLEF